MPASRPLVLLLAIAVVGVALVIAVLVTTSRLSQPNVLQFQPPETATSTPSDGQMKVYVAGAVQRPGVYSVRPGDRVADAVEAAGGPTDDADTLVVNLARRLRDEDHVLVPRRGEPAVLALADSSAARRVDINTAPASALETLPGIGPTRAKSIVESRARHGPFTEPAELVKRKLLPQSVFDGLKDLIDVRP